jgi:hypothetical protein
MVLHRNFMLHHAPEPVPYLNGPLVSRSPRAQKFNSHGRDNRSPISRFLGYRDTCISTEVPVPEYLLMVDKTRNKTDDGHFLIEPISLNPVEQTHFLFPVGLNTPFPIILWARGGGGGLSSRGGKSKNVPRQKALPRCYSMQGASRWHPWCEPSGASIVPAGLTKPQPIRDCRTLHGAAGDHQSDMSRLAESVTYTRGRLVCTLRARTYKSAARPSVTLQQHPTNKPGSTIWQAEVRSFFVFDQG